MIETGCIGLAFSTQCGMLGRSVLTPKHLWGFLCLALGLSCILILPFVKFWFSFPLAWSQRPSLINILCIKFHLLICVPENSSMTPLVLYHIHFTRNLYFVSTGSVFWWGQAEEIYYFKSVFWLGQLEQFINFPARTCVAQEKDHFFKKTLIPMVPKRAVEILQKY